MSEELKQKRIPSPTRRHLFTLAAAAVGSLPFVALPSRSSAQVLRCPPGTISPKCYLHSQCFLYGTQVLTTKGEARVEEIAVGDLVVTARGDRLPVKWIGRRRFTKNGGSSWQTVVLPVRISRFAIDNQTPHADLYVSPAHALFIDGVLIPAIHLVNGASIVQVMPEGVEDIQYFHIELETHEVIFAEGAAVETLLVTNGRESFDNFFEYERLYGTDNRPAMTSYAPLVCYNGGRSELRALMRRVASPVVDIRDPIQLAYDRIAARATELVGCKRSSDHPALAT
jgi:Hint domain